MIRTISAFLLSTIFCATLAFGLIYAGAFLAGEIFAFDFMFMVMVPVIVGVISACHIAVRRNQFI